MLTNAYLVANIGADTAENEQQIAEILPRDGRSPRDGAVVAAFLPHPAPVACCAARSSLQPIWLRVGKICKMLDNFVKFKRVAHFRLHQHLLEKSE